MATSIIEHVPKLIEQGTDGIWEYRKWSDGTAECWGVHRASITHYGQSFGGYAYETLVTFPTDLFVDIPLITYSAQIGNGLSLTGTITNSITKNVFRAYAVSNYSNTQSTAWFLRAIGKWK